MKDNQTKVALNWVKDEVEGTLEQAQLAIKAFAEDESDKTQIHFCANCMHQIRGTMQMLEFFGAALMAEEMEALAEAIGEGKVDSNEQAYEVFLSAILRFKSYLARYGEDKPDLPVILLPIINDMRTCRNEELLGVGNLITIPTEGVDVPVAPVRTELQGDILAEVKALRLKYQQGLLGVIRDVDVDTNLERMQGVTQSLWGLGNRVPYEALWWVASVFLKQVKAVHSQDNVAVKGLLGQIDRRIRELIEQNVNQQDADKLLTNLLFYVAQFDIDDEQVHLVQESYKLNQLLASLGDLEDESKDLAGPDASSMRIVLTAIQEDLTEIKESLDLYIRTNSQDSEQLEELLPAMQKISDTMAILSLGQSRNLIQEQMTAVNNLIDGTQPDRTQGLVSIAEAVLKLEDYIERAMSMDSKQLANETEGLGDGESLQVVNARYQLVQESRGNLHKVKDAISDYLDENHNIDRLVNVPELLKEAEGALSFAQLDNLLEVVAKTNNFISKYLVSDKVVLSEDEVSTLADALSSVDYYLEGLMSSGLHGLPIILQRATDSINELEAHYGALEEETLPVLEDSFDMPEIEMVELEPVEAEPEEDDDDLIDDEVREIFIEEAEEVLEEMHRLLPVLKQDTHNQEALSTVRRNFHTLKGSGRMVGATDIGELAWSIENMLNRWIDNSIEYSPAVLITMEQAAHLIPAMVIDFAEGNKTNFPEELADRAHRISKGEIITDLEPAIEVEAEPEMTPEQELFEIFKQEAEGHVTNLEMFANQRVQGITQSHISDNLLRSLHTLKGVAHIANIQSLSNVIVPVESYFQELKTRELMAEEGDMGLIAHTKDLLKHIIETPDDEQVITAHEEAIIYQLSSLQTRFDEELQTDEDMGRDPELIKDVFNVAADVLADIEGNSLQETVEDQRLDSVSYLMASTDRLRNVLMAADIPEIEVIVTAMGDALQRNMTALAVDPSLDELLNTSHSQLENQFDCLAANLSIPEAPDLVKALQEWQPEVVMVELSESDVVEDQSVELELVDELADSSQEQEFAKTISLDLDMDDELLEIFTEEAEELFDSDAGLLQRLRQDPADKSVIAELQRNLHTLKGSARMAGFTPIGDLAHGIEDLYTAITDQLIPPSKEAVNLAEKAEDKLLAIFSARTTPHMIPSPEGMLAEINQFILDQKSAPRVDADDVIEDAIDELEVELSEVTNDHITIDDIELETEIGQQDSDDESLIDFDLEQDDSADEEIEIEETLESTIEQDDEDSIEELAEEIVDESIEEIVEESLESAGELQEDEVDSDEILEQLEETIDELDQDTAETVVEELEEVAESLTENLESLDESVDEAVEDIVEETTESVEDADWNQELAELFLGEATELLASYDEAVERWATDNHDTDHLRAAMRSLHTLKSGARLAAISPIGDLTHKLESVLEVLARDNRLGQTRWVDMLRHSHDEIHAMVNSVRDGRMPAEPEELLRKLENDKSIIEAQIEQLEKRDLAESGEQAEVKVISLAERQRQKDEAAKEAANRDVIRVRSEVLDNLVNLSGEASIFRSRLEQQVADLNFNLHEMSSTVERLRDQLRNMEIETEAQVSYRKEVEGVDLDDFDPLEMDRYTRQQELTRSLLEAASDLLSIQETLETKVGDAEATLLAQGRVNTELQDRLMRTRMVPFNSIESRLRRMVRQIANELGKEVELDLRSEGEMDRTVIERMVAPLDHMLRNAIDHGIESKEERQKAGKPAVGKVTVDLTRRGNEVFIQIQDDGAGIRKDKVKQRAVAQGMIDESYEPTDRELYRLILQPGFSTAEKVTQISGRGVGMDVVHSEILQLGGSLQVSSETNQGTTMTVRLPFTLSSNQALMVKVKGENFAIPLSNITTVARVSAQEIVDIYQNKDKSFNHLGQEYELRYLGQILDRNSDILAPADEFVPVLIIQGEEKPIAVHVDELLGSREIVVKSVGRQLSTVPGMSGASILGDGSVVLILDMQTLVDRFHEWDFAHEAGMAEEIPVEDRVPTVMVVDDSITVRKVTARLLQRHQFQVMTAKDGVDALTQLHDDVPDVMLLDIEMPRMDGFELATIIRHDERLKHLPIIMITSRTGEKHRERAEQIGVNRYLGKPYNEDTLLGTISEMLEKDEE
ncbi:MAG: Hpt domain-containing protein [Kangiellaceae bacterium]|nr:Hpt domain-containing protein [Kangiellaceae bacterium]